jgi:hypothetical protein
VHQHAITSDGLDLCDIRKGIDEGRGPRRLAVGLETRGRHLRGAVARRLGGCVVDETDDDAVACALAQGGGEGGRGVIAETEVVDGDVEGLARAGDEIGDEFRHAGDLR